ncbi:MAG TPA: protein kinase [Polyangiaceae bacterium]|nr:protein kinase [Polyangiaceae bacterium]
MSDVAKDASKHVGETRLESRVETKGAPKPDSVSGRYAVGKLLGEGGMAAVYQATDLSTGREVALKQFTLPRDDRHYKESAGLFEHEFLTLAQLSHPRIIEVYDYSLGDAGPYYTMELIDGGDLRERTPMPWREACAVIYDVCSSLALIHSRRLVHRDVSPRNIRCTRDGQAKLIDFGALVPMGPGDIIVGTPQFVAPEVVYRSVLDARTDLFSVGATLYYTLTGRVPYPVKTFQQLIEAWETKPVPPSKLVEGIPATLDTLVLSLISVEPSSRPHSAFEVMQHLAAIAGLERVEPESVSRAYLSTPTMVGREGLMANIERELGRSVAGRGRALLIQAAAGMGRSRVLDATALAAKAHGTTVVRAYGGAAASQGFKAATALVEHLAAAAPEVALSAAKAENVTELLFGTERQSYSAKIGGSRLAAKDLSTLQTARVDLQDALGRWFLAVTELMPLVIAVDDLHRIDEPSLALLAALASQADRKRLFIAATAELDVEASDRAAFSVFRQNSTRLSLGPLDHTEVEHLLASVFGDVPNLHLVTEGIHTIARGNPRACMDLAQHLADKGLVRYADGAWTLPARLDLSDLPASVEAALQARIAALSPLARLFAQAQAVATHKAFTRDDFTRLTRATAREIDAAIGDLVSSQLVVSDGRIYSIANENCRAALVSSLDAAETVERHRALIDVYLGRKVPFGVMRHALAAGLDARGLDELAPSLAEAPEKSALLLETMDINPTELATTFVQALEAAERLGRPQRERHELRRWIASLGVLAEARFFSQTAPEWRARLELDSGYTDYRAHPEIEDRAERLSNAMRLAYERYFATPEADRVYRPDEAIQLLVRLVAMTIAVATARIELELLESLPDLLEPFAPLNELVDIVYKNAIATREITCRVRPERGRELWIEVYERLGTVQGVEAQYVSLIRNAVAFGVGTCEAWMGMQSATTWAERLDDVPLQRVSGLQLRRSVRIQLGDWEAAERLRKEAEILALQTQSRQMFPNVLQVEINAFALAADMTALKHAIDRAKALAENAPGWVPTALIAEARFQVLCSNFQAALDSVESALALLETRYGVGYPLGTAWCGAVATRMEALMGLGRFEDARRIGEEAIAKCVELDIRVTAHDIARALALAEGRLGDYDKAAARLSRVIEEQLAYGISGLRLGASYEARARVAIWANDAALAEEYMRHTAREYRHGQGSALGARYERLVQEAQRIADGKLPSLSEFESSNDSTSIPTSATVVVTQAMKGVGGATERAERALDLLCDERAAAGGFLYLFKQHRLRLVASRGARRPPEEFEAFLTRFLAHELADNEAATRVLTEPIGEDEVVEKHYTDSLGLKFYPVFLRGVIGQESRVAGVVAFGYHGDPPQVDDKLVVALSTHFIESGYSDALEYGDWEVELDD